MSSILIRLSFIGFVTALSSRCVDPVIPQIAWGLQIDPATVALLSTAFALPFALVQPVLGPVADMVGKIRVMVLCLAVLVIASLVCAARDQFHRAVRRAHRLPAWRPAAFSRSALALIGDLVPIKERQVALGRWLIVIMTGNLLGASVAGVVNDLLGWRAVFLVIAGAGFAGFPARRISRCAMPRASIARASICDDVPTGYAGIFGNPRAKVCYSAVFIEGACDLRHVSVRRAASARGRRSARLDRGPRARRLLARRRDLCG